MLFQLWHSGFPYCVGKYQFQILGSVEAQLTGSVCDTLHCTQLSHLSATLRHICTQHCRIPGLSCTKTLKIVVYAYFYVSEKFICKCQFSSLKVNPAGGKCSLCHCFRWWCKGAAKKTKYSLQETLPPPWACETRPRLKNRQHSWAALPLRTYATEHIVCGKRQKA